MKRLSRLPGCLFFSLVSLFAFMMLPAKVEASSATNPIKQGRLIADLVATAYQGTEKLRYAVSYTGGIALGHLELSIQKKIQDQQPQQTDEVIEIKAHVTTDGSLFDLVYPINDRYTTRVQGPERLPVYYKVKQKEGWGYKAERLTRYDQTTGVITYQKNDKPVKAYEVSPPVHNEFSAFFASRLMFSEPDQTFIVPTFADKRRTEVEVRVVGNEQLNTTLLGTVKTHKVTPILRFKGLYDKEGDTTIWYTADECRVPVKINSKIAIGSITADLLYYENPLCESYHLKGRAM